ncbi:MAG TPA: YihY/virulence factor BrkB family protein, partial [Pyrinomonadaceae bacterium]
MDRDDEKAITSVWRLGGLTRRELARRVWADAYEGDLLTRAAALSYYFLLALFPLLIFLTAMLGHFAEAGTELRKNLLNYFASIAPRTASQLIRATIEEITEGAGGGKLSFGLLAALWFASFGMGAVGDTLNSAYGVRESRPWWRVRLISLGLTAALAALIISALSLVLYGGEIGEGLAGRYDLGGAFVVAWNVIQWPIVLAFVLSALALIYYYAPDLRHQRWYWITP